ncbi:MAG: hypothetical protein CXZ00_03915 [Acidobacteria bacterium]|nr:MAG: hypothetical protein CXZ00_03915 [Acidobacteriota bacterium]
MVLSANGRTIMNQTTLLIIFVAITAVAVVLQMLILAGMYFIASKLSKRMEELSTRVEEQALPLVRKVRGIVDESTPLIQKVVMNVTETSSIVRTQAENISEVVSEIADRTRSQAERADKLVTRTMQRVDIAAEAVQHSVTSPLRRVSAVMEGIRTGVGEYMAGRGSRGTKNAPNEQMFI